MTVQSPTATADHEERVQRIHEGAYVIDGRDPTFLLYRQTGDEKEGYWEALGAGGVTAVLVDVPWIDDDFRSASLNLAAWHERVAARSDAIIVRSAADLEAAKRDGKRGVVLTSQTPTIMEDKLELLRALYEQGLRVMQLSYQARNFLADGVGEVNDGGLSELGAKAVHEMNRLGIAIDLSHASDGTIEGALRESERPLLASHSNARARVDQKRNLTDAFMRAIADGGGVCGVTAYSAFLKPDGISTGTTLADWVAMVEYVVNLIGEDHVGIGFDVGEQRTREEAKIISAGKTGVTHDPLKRYVVELQTRANFMRITDALLGHGFSETTTEKILGGNLLRFFREVWGA
jgi:membrane dipeptidase